jgi:hypothetical protein
MDSIWWATSYQHKERKHITTRKCTKQDHLAVTIVLGAEVASNDLDRHHQNSMVELEDRDPQMKNATMQMTKKRWGIMLYPQGSHHSSSQGIQATS